MSNLGLDTGAANVMNEPPSPEERHVLQTEEHSPLDDAKTSPSGKRPKPCELLPPLEPPVIETSKELQRGRPISRKTALSIGGVAVALGGALYLSKRVEPARREEDKSSSVSDQFIVGDDALHNFRDTTFLDFHVPQPVAVSGAVPEGRSAPALDESGKAEALSDRQSRRDKDPEDLISSRTRAGRAGDETPTYRRAFVYFEDRPVAGSVTGRPTGRDGEQQLAPAGTVVQVTLSSPIDLQGGSCTVVAVAAEKGALPEGTRFIGTASADARDDRLSLRFNRLVLPTGKEAQIFGEGQDQDGGFGLGGNVEGGGEEEPAVAKEVAKDTSADVALDYLGMGVGGHAVRNYLHRSSYSRMGQRPALRISLAKGARFRVFLHDAVMLRD